MQHFNKNKPLEYAAAVFELGSIESNSDFEGFAGFKNSNDRHLCCASCHSFNTIKKVRRKVNGKWKKRWKCDRCGAVNSNAVALAAKGPSCSETRTVKLPAGEPIDAFLAKRIFDAVRSCSDNAQAWFIYSSTSVYDRDRDVIDVKSKELSNAVIEAISPIAGRFDLSESVRVFALVKRLIVNERLGTGRLTDAEAAKLVKVERIQFNANRRWGRLRSASERVMNDWLKEISDSVGVVLELY